MFHCQKKSRLRRAKKIFAKLTFLLVLDIIFFSTLSLSFLYSISCEPSKCPWKGSLADGRIFFNCGSPYGWSQLIDGEHLKPPRTIRSNERYVIERWQHCWYNQHSFHILSLLKHTVIPRLDTFPLLELTRWSKQIPKGLFSLQMANYGYNMTQARLIGAIPTLFPKLLQMHESSGVDDMSDLSELR